MAGSWQKKGFDNLHDNIMTGRILLTLNKFCCLVSLQEKLTY